MTQSAGGGGGTDLCMNDYRQKEKARYKNKLQRGRDAGRWAPTSQQARKKTDRRKINKMSEI